MNRKLKIQTHITASTRFKPAKYKPKLLLQGDWFSKAGFNPDDEVSVVADNGVITIKKHHEFCICYILCMGHYTGPFLS